MALIYQAYGAAREVTGSKHLFRRGSNSWLLDCGAFQGHRVESQTRNLSLPFDPAKLDDVLLSHAHFDHSGNLPTLIKKGFTGNIHATPATRDIANLILMDSAHIQQKDYDFIKRKRPGETPVEPLYGVRDVLTTIEHMVTMSYRRPMRLAGGVTAQFLEAGHILGASMVHLTFPAADGEKGMEVLYTGDIGRRGMPIIRDPERIPDVDYILCEGTYGNRLHDPIDDALDQLAEVINSTFSKGGKVIIPAFAVERTQELIYFLHLLSDRERIPNAEIFIDSPMAVNATSIFKVHQECYNERVFEQFLEHHKNPFGFEHVRYVTHVSESKLLNDRKMPCIIISASGMCEAGRILHHLKNNITNPANTVLIVGYMAEGTLGRKIADREKTVRIFGQTYPLNCRVKILNTFSAHADYSDIVDYLRPVNKQRLRGVYLVHGEEAALENLRGELRKIGIDNVAIPHEGEKIHLV